MKNKIIAILLLLISTNLVAEKFTLVAENNTYKNVKLQLYTYKNLLTQEEIFVSDISFDDNGKINKICNIGNQPQIFFIPLYSFKLLFYAEPNKTIDIKMPSLEKVQNYFKQAKSYDDREVVLYLNTKQSLNNEINIYNASFSKLLHIHFKELHNSKSTKEILAELSKIRPNKKSDTQYLKEYIKYKKAYIDYVAGFQKDILPKYFENKPINLSTTSYVSLLKKMAKDKVYDFVNTRDYATYRDAKDYSSLRKLSVKLAGADIPFSELFLISMIYEGTQNDFLEKHRSIRHLKTIINNTSNKTNKQIAISVLQTIKGFFYNKKAPSFSVVGDNDEKYTEKELIGDSSTILLFVDNERDNSKTINELNEIHRKNPKAFDMLLFQCGFESNEIDGSPFKQFFVPFQSKMLRDYRIGKFPYIVLVNKDGKISHKPAQYFLSHLK